jgi:hypothetical protein
MVDQAFLKDERVRCIDDDEANDLAGMILRHVPGDHPAEIVPDQKKALNPHRVRESQNVLDDRGGAVGFDRLRPIGGAEAAQVRHNQPKAGAESRDQGTPGAMRLWKSVKENGWRRIDRPGQTYVQFDAGAKRNPAELRHG